MAFGSFFTRALDRFTPWNRGGEVQRNQERKKRKDEEDARRAAQAATAPNNRVTPNQNADIPGLPKPQQPVNIFENLNKNLVFNKPQSAVPVVRNPNSAVVPQPGTVIKPTDIAQGAVQSAKIATAQQNTPESMVNRGLDQGKSWEDIARENKLDINSVKKYSQATRPDYGITIARPKQGLGNRIRDIFDTNTESDKFRRQEGNRQAYRESRPEEVKPLTMERSGNIFSRTPIVGHVLKGINTLANQDREVRATIRGLIASRTNNPEAFRNATAEQDKLRQNYMKNKGGLFNSGTLYDSEASKRGDVKTGITDIALPSVVTMLDLYTLGKGSAISEGIKQGGLRAGIRTQAPNIIKAGVGNYGSGDLSARSQGATNEQAVKSGLINSILGLVPDIGLPTLAKGLRNKVLPRLLRGRGISPEVAVEELDDAAISASAEAANQALRPRPIPVRSNIPVDEILSEANVPVRAIGKPPGNVIREVTGDAAKTTRNSAISERVAQVRRAEAEAANNVPVDRRIEGVTPRGAEKPFALNENAVVSAQDKFIDDYATTLRDLGEGNGTQLVPDGEGGYFRSTNNFRSAENAGKRMSKAAWREEAERQLKAGQAEPGIQKAFNETADPEVQALLTKGEQSDLPEGSPIAVKQATGIPVTDQTVVPTDLPETPGTVRATTATAPSNAKSELVAAQPPAAILPKETQNILDNPKQFNKRQVAAARNQRKLAMQMAKTQEQTAEALGRIETASPAAASGEGFTPTGEFARSQNGGAYQKVSRAAEMQQAVQETSQMSPGDVLKTARDNQAGTGGFNHRDIRNIAAMFETKRLPRGSAEWNEARQILKEDGTVWGQTGALRNYTKRRTATANELISRYESKIYRLADDPSKIDGKLFDQVEAAEDAYTTARDNALAAYNEFTRNPTSANTKLYHAAQDAAENADRAAKQTEYQIAEKVLKGNKDVKQIRELEKMANDADLYQMDAVDASMLSGTGTFLRNFVNSAVGGAEEGLFGKAGSRIARKITGQTVGGGVGKGSASGFGEGVENLRSVAGARASNAGKNPLSHLKNWATTGNQLGDTVIDSQVKHNVIDHYKQLLKDQGYTGRELADRASVMARQDPDNLAREYAGAARVSAGLGSGITRNNKVETLVKNVVSDAVSAGKPTPLSEATGKLVARMTIGFPTAIGRSTVEGVKRFTLGAPTFIKAVREADPLKRSILVKEGIKQAGTGGLVLPPMFYALGASGMISGAYPSDKETRAQWEREGKTENSIKIGGAWYQLPAYLGAWAVPGLFYASLGRNGGSWSEATTDVAKAIPSILPTDQASNIMDVINGRSDLGKFMSQQGAAAVRAATPAGALLNQISKAFDPTKNDTTSGTNLENFFDKVLSGIPGVNNAANIPDKTDDAGNPLTNPNAVETFLGAASDVQGSGEERTNQLNQEINSGIGEIDSLLNDPNLDGVLEGTALEALNKLKSGKQLDASDAKALREGLVKGVSSEGTDTAYLEREQYDTNLAVLKLKRDLMDDDPTVRPSSLKDVDTAIKRGEIYKSSKIPYDFITSYKDTSLTEWRKMGDPESDEYDPEMYQKLFNLDKRMADADVSYRSGSLDKPKYFAKESGKGGRGRGGKGSRNIDTSFGTLKTGSYAPRVQEYAGIDAKSGSIPFIRVVRPNIVHKISSSG